MLDWDEKNDALAEFLLVLVPSKSPCLNLFICLDGQRRNTWKLIKINSHDLPTTVESIYYFLKASAYIRKKGRFPYSEFLAFTFTEKSLMTSGKSVSTIHKHLRGIFIYI